MAINIQLSGAAVMVSNATCELSFEQLEHVKIRSCYGRFPAVEHEAFITETYHENTVHGLQQRSRKVCTRCRQKQEYHRRDGSERPDWPDCCIDPMSSQSCPTPTGTLRKNVSAAYSPLFSLTLQHPKTGAIVCRTCKWPVECHIEAPDPGEAMLSALGMSGLVNFLTGGVHGSATGNAANAPGGIAGPAGNPAVPMAAANPMVAALMMQQQQQRGLRAGNQPPPQGQQNGVKAGVAQPAPAPAPTTSTQRQNGVKPTAANESGSNNGVKQQPATDNGTKQPTQQQQQHGSKQQPQQQQKPSGIVQDAPPPPPPPSVRHAGFLSKYSVGRTGLFNNWKKRYFALDVNGTLTYRETAQSPTALSTIKLGQPGIFKRLVPHCTKANHPQAEHPETDLVIVFQEGSFERQLLLRGGSAEDHDAWIEVLQSLLKG